MTSVVLVSLSALVLLSLFSLVRAVVHRDAKRDDLTAAATRALPPGARSVTAGFFGTTHAYVIADLAKDSAVVLASYSHGWGGTQWKEIPGTATPDARSFLSAGKDRILEVTVDPCHREREHCPQGGSTITVEVMAGGPKS